ncbi:MAG: DNA polymerase [Candidatus Paceibacterota bacterium]
MAQNKKTLVLLDTHAILHRAYHALPGFTSPTGEPTGALFGVVSMLIKIVEDLKPDYLVACYDLPEPTHRHQAFDGYKAKRLKTDDELITQINRSRDIMKVLNIPIYELPGFEADDMLGTIVCELRQDKSLDIIIASGDMDTLQLIEGERVRVFAARKGADVVMFDEERVMEKFGFGPLLTIDFKGLRGDASDNIPGVPGVGEGSAQKLVATYGPIEKIYAAIKKEGVEGVSKKAAVQKRFVQLVAEHEEEAQFSKMLATIRQDAPIDFHLPEKTWREGVDINASLALFSELGFRSPTARFRQLLDIKDEEVSDKGNQIAAADIAEVAVMLWLVESDRTNPTYDEIIDYGRSEFGTTDWLIIKSRLEEELGKRDLLEVFNNIDKPLLPAIEEMNKTGITVDVKYLKKLSDSFHLELDSLQKHIHELAGEDFNINSPKQLGVILYDKLSLKPARQKKTAGGARSTRESELVQMVDMHPIIGEILRYRELSKLVSTYVDNLPKMVGKDGRLRTTFLPTGTVTGRVGSKDPNLQNIPIRSEEGRSVRRAFIPAEGYTLVAIDYSQIELRIAAILSGDERLIDIFKNGQDVHTGVASRVFGVPESEVTPDMRRKAKVINFGILYGMGVNALRVNLGEGTTREAAQEFLNAYFNTFTRLAEYLEETKSFARNHGYTKTMFGRRRYFPGISSVASFIRASAERMAINAPIQGTEGDILRIALVRITDYLKKNNLQEKARVLLQVHDELVFEVKKDSVDEIVPSLKKIMSDVLDSHDTEGVPIEVEVKSGRNWADMVQFKSF